MTVKFNYKRHHFEYLLKCNNSTEALKNWPFDDMVPSKRSVDRRLFSVKTYGIDKCLKGGNYSKGRKWTEEEEELLVLAYDLCEGSEGETVKLFMDIFPDRTALAVESWLSVMQANFKLKRKITKANTSDPVDYYEALLSRGFMPVKDSIGFGHTLFEVECIEYGHKSIVRACSSSRCNLCTQAGSLPLSQLKNHKLGKHPCIIYFVQFEDGTLKTGHTKNETQLRGRDWPPFKIVKEIETTYYHARRIETETQNQCDRIPEYLPLQGNGGTECFEEKHYERILEILNKEEKDLLEHEKNSS